MNTNWTIHTNLSPQESRGSSRDSIRLHKIQLVSIAKIKLDLTNPNVMTSEQIEGLRESVRRFGYLDPVILDQGLMVADGEHRLQVYKEFGRATVPCYVLQLKDDNERRLLRQTMNNLRGEHDRSKDLQELSILEHAGRLDDLATLIGKEPEDLLRILNRYDQTPIIQEHDPSTVIDAPEVKRGQLWRLGDHKLLCGDATDKQDIQKLLNDEKVDCLLTDPPCGVDYADKNEFLNKGDRGNRSGVPITGDTRDDIRSFTNRFLELVPWADYNTAYIFTGSLKYHEAVYGLQDAGLTFAHMLIWFKRWGVVGRADYSYAHEPIVNAHTRRPHYRQTHEAITYSWNGKHRFYGNSPTTVLEFSKPIKNDLHPTQKPLDLIATLMMDGTDKKAIVYDPLAGCGTTLIAAEKIGRKARVMDIEPHYCRVMINRWQRHAGGKAELVN